MGWGAWILVGLCVLFGVGLILIFRGRPGRPVPATESAPSPPATRAAPAGGTGGASTGGQTGGSPATPRGGEGKVTLSPQEGLRVLWAQPKAGLFVYPHSVIEVHFSAPMDRGSVQQAFEIFPEVPGNQEWPHPDQMVFRPRQLLDLGVEYRVRLGSSATDLRRVEGLHPYEWTFQVYGGYTYHQNVGPLMRYACGSCHGAGGSAARVPLGTYTQAMSYVQKKNAAASPLYAALGDPRRHAQVPPGGQAMSYVIRDWIEKFDAAE